MWFVIGTYLLLVFALPITVAAAISYRGLPRGRSCPHCHGDTLQLAAPALAACSRVLPGGALQRRWCLCCGWEGTTRLPQRAQPLTVPGFRAGTGSGRRSGGRPSPGEAGTSDVIRSDARSGGAAGGDGGRAAGRPDPAPSPALRRTRARQAETDAARAEPRPTTQTLDVRSLTLDGTPWRVMLQCWRNTGCYYGRFVFVAPSGRLWLDSIEAFSGSSEHEVLGEALSLPDGLLATRLRRLVTD